MSTPVVVQGKPVVVASQPYAPSVAGFATTGLETSAPSGASSSSAFEGKKQSSCNDPIFVVLFYAALGSILGVAALYGPAALDAADETTANETPIDYTGYVVLTVICVGISFFGAGAGMALLFCIPQFLIKAALIFTVIMSGVMMVLSFLSGSIMGGVIGLLFFALTCCYARAVWSRIPFATANLVTACTAVKANLGIAFYAYVFALMAGGWSIAWSLAFVGVFDQTSDCSNADGVCDSPGYGLLFVLFLAFFFVEQVIQVRWRMICWFDFFPLVASLAHCCCDVCTAYIELDSRRDSGNGRHLVVRSGRMWLLHCGREQQFHSYHDDQFWFHLFWQFLGGHCSGTQSAGPDGARKW